MTNLPRQCFAVDVSVFRAMSAPEVEATWKDMVEAGIALPPYPEFVLMVPASAYAQFLVDDYSNVRILFEMEGLDRETIDYGMTRIGEVAGHPEGYSDTWCHMSYNWRDNLVKCGSFVANSKYSNVWKAGNDFNPMTDDVSIYARLYRGLLVLLATRNVERVTKIDKLARLGIGSRSTHRYVYTTTLKIGNITEYVDGTTCGSDVPRRPHLRRGHVRRQRHGPGLEFTKVIFISPVFVNAADGVVAERQQYNVS